MKTAKQFSGSLPSRLTKIRKSNLDTVLFRVLLDSWGIYNPEAERQAFSDMQLATNNRTALKVNRRRAS